MIITVGYIFAILATIFGIAFSMNNLDSFWEGVAFTSMIALGGFLCGILILPILAVSIVVAILEAIFC